MRGKKHVGIPRFRGKTALDALKWVQRVIKREPKRYNQTIVCHIRGGYDSSHVLEDNYPACGTIGCVAGWIFAGTAPKVVRNDVEGFTNALFVARKLLGLSGPQSAALFHGGAAMGDGQTQEHADSGIRHIQNFIDLYKRQLRARRITAATKRKVYEPEVREVLRRQRQAAEGGW